MKKSSEEYPKNEANPGFGWVREMEVRYVGKPRQAPLISSARDVVRLLQGKKIADSPREQAFAIVLGGRRAAIGVERIGIGTLTGMLIHPREVFRLAVREAAREIILVHNHPSGDPRPSQEDRDITKRLRNAGELIGIEVTDHVIIASSGFYSLRAEEGW